MSEDKAMKYCYDYLDLVELVRYYDINTYEKIFGHGGRHGHLKLMIDRKVTKLISEDLILVNTELQAKLDKAIEALKFYAGIDNWVCDASVTTSDGKEKYYNSHIIINDDYEEKRKPIGGKRARATLKELGVE